MNDIWGNGWQDVLKNEENKENKENKMSKETIVLNAGGDNQMEITVYGKVADLIASVTIESQENKCSHIRYIIEELEATITEFRKHEG